MNNEQIHAAFEAWAASIGFCVTGKYAETVDALCADSAFKAGYKAALQSQPTEAFPSRIIEADFETDTVTLEMHGTYTVSGGQKYLCDAPMQSQDREDALKAENVRLRDALETIAAYPYSRDQEMGAAAMRKVARDALAATRGESNE